MADTSPHGEPAPLYRVWVYGVSSDACTGAQCGWRELSKLPLAGDTDSKAATASPTSSIQRIQRLRQFRHRDHLHALDLALGGITFGDDGALETVLGGL